MIFDPLYRFARGVRNLPGLRNCRGLWSFLHRPYYALLHFTGWSVKYPLTDDVMLTVPAYFLRQNWRSYEPDGIAVFIRWLRATENKSRVVMDIGSSIGFYSTVALFADPNVEVFAFDPDLESLRLVHRFCSKVPNLSQLHSIWCFLDKTTSSTSSMVEAEALTETQRKQTKASGRLEHIAYRNLHDKADADVGTPIYTLDALTQNGQLLDHRAVLFKCDVEGAELYVLQGAQEFIKRLQPTMLLSVHHATWLSRYNTTPADIENFLKSVDYQWTVLSSDHEDHWLAMPANSQMI
ncbi:MAG: FkbM family methyltransferase [Chthoniobacterales bacterium]